MTTTRRQEQILAALIASEIVFFSFTGHHFFTITNFFECIRLAVEIGLLALALTPVIVSGGIDLSVGSMMGLCAVSFGALWQQGLLSLWGAVAVTLLIGCLGGALNGVLISKFRVSPLIVTLGTYSLFRGLAEAITLGAKSYSGFPSGFLFLGQGYLGGIFPTQTIFLVVAAVAFWALLHRSIAGRGIYAIGHSAEAARYAAVPVASRVTLVYLLCGLSSGIAAILYVAHLGQAKSDAGTGYELIAITAVILGGASIFGGSGTIGGTLMGMGAIVVLQNGLLLSGWPTELAGIATGGLLIATIGLERIAHRRSLRPNAGPSRRRSSRSRSLALGVIAFFLVVGFVLAARFSRKYAGPAGARRNITIGVMPKAKGDPYFISCRKGAEEAAKALHIDLLWDGPTGLDAAQQNQIVEGWITRHVDAISVAVENGPSISTVLRKARQQGIKVVTWDADAQPDARDYFVNQATPQAIGYTLLDEAARLMQNRGEFAVITGALSAANQNEWIASMRERLRLRYPDMRLVAIRPSDDDHDKAFAETQTLLRVYPKIRVFIGISAPAVPGAGEAVKQSGRRDVQVIGLSLPNICKPYVHEGVIEAVVLWNTQDLGYLAVAVPAALARGAHFQQQTIFHAGRLGDVTIAGSEIVLGKPIVFRKDNIDLFHF